MLAPMQPHVDGSLPAAESILAQARHENFPVASFVLPRDTRAHLMAIYGFARLADDIGDRADGDRMALLDWLDSELERAASGTATHPLLQRLSATIDEFDLSLTPFQDLIQANRLDQAVSRYETFDDLRGYCMLSAAPIGRLVLSILRADEPAHVAWSDDVCVGLQIVEHLQDVGEDAAAGRVYLPMADLRRLGCSEQDVRAPSATPGLRRVIATEAARARRLLVSGTPLAGALPLRGRVAVAGFAAGGLAALDAIERSSFDVLAVRCRPKPLRLAARIVEGVAAATRAREPSWT